MHTASVRLPDELYERLEKISELTGKNKSTFIVEALSEYLDDLEDYTIAAKRMRNYDSTESISLEKMKEIYNVED